MLGGRFKSAAEPKPKAHPTTSKMPLIVDSTTVAHAGVAKASSSHGLDLATWKAHGGHNLSTSHHVDNNGCVTTTTNTFHAGVPDGVGWEHTTTTVCPDPPFVVPDLPYNVHGLDPLVRRYLEKKALLAKTSGQANVSGGVGVGPHGAHGSLDIHTDHGHLGGDFGPHGTHSVNGGFDFGDPTGVHGGMSGQISNHGQGWEVSGHVDIPL